jgi:hypothetical protein
MNYAMNLIIDSDLSECANEKITRREFANILYKSIPESDYIVFKSNNVKRDELPDTLDKHISGFEKLSCAGIITAQDKNGDYISNEYITRGEVASVLTRMLEYNARLNRSK